MYHYVTIFCRISVIFKLTVLICNDLSLSQTSIQCLTLMKIEVKDFQLPLVYDYIKAAIFKAFLKLSPIFKILIENVYGYNLDFDK